MKLTFQQYDGEVLSGLCLARGKALVSSRVSFLRRRNEQSLVVTALDGEVLVGQDGFCVAVPRHGIVRRTLDGAGQDDCAADARLEVLGGQGDP